MSAKSAILERLKKASLPLAVHELGLIGYNENNLATRLSELATDGFVIGRKRQGKQYKEWRLV